MSFPFAIEERATVDADIEGIFSRAFHAPPPSSPRHFVGVHAGEPRRVCAYVHYTAFEPGVYLLGGLCVDASIYKDVSPEVREAVAAKGSLSRWVMEASIAALGPTRAVFAYTGNVMSRRDTDALGFRVARPPYLIVQWHDEPAAAREALAERIAKLGPF
jgi:hypothetical protein